MDHGDKKAVFDYLIELLEDDFDEFFDRYLSDYLHDHADEIDREPLTI